jgi:hypothetical protein
MLAGISDTSRFVCVAVGCVVCNLGGHGKSKIKYTKSIVKMDRLPDPLQCIIFFLCRAKCFEKFPSNNSLDHMCTHATNSRNNFGVGGNQLMIPSFPSSYGGSPFHHPPPPAPPPCPPRPCPILFHLFLFRFPLVLAIFVPIIMARAFLVPLAS